MRLNPHSIHYYDMKLDLFYLLFEALLHFSLLCKPDYLSIVCIIYHRMGHSFSVPLLPFPPSSFCYSRLKLINNDDKDNINGKSAYVKKTRTI